MIILTGRSMEIVHNFCLNNNKEPIDNHSNTSMDQNTPCVFFESQVNMQVNHLVAEN